MSSTRWLGWLAILVHLPFFPALSAPQATQPESMPLYESGLATLDLGTRQFPLGYSVTPLGPLFSLHAVVAHLGGDLKLGPLSQSHELTLDRARFIFGPDSSAVTMGTEIYSLSQRPMPAEDGLRVPLDLLETVYSEQLGYEFQWDAASRSLRVRKLPAREIPLIVDLVHLQGVTTVVLQFESRPRYRVQRSPGQVAVELIGDRLQAAAKRSLPAQSLVRDMVQTADGIRLVLAPGTEAHDYVLQNPFRLVVDVFRAAPTAGARPATPVVPRRDARIRTIVIDPGHGGADTGAIGGRGTAEKTLTLMLARTLQARLEERLPAQVILTRTEDVNLPLDTRTSVANQQKADLFISLHVNSVQDPATRGAETYFSSLQASDARAAEAAAIENRAGLSSGIDGDPLYDLQLILWDLAQSHYMVQSQRLAMLVQEELNEALGLRNRGVKQAPFRVLLGASMPAILVECGFLSNPDEETKLLNPEHRLQVVNSLVRAVLRFQAQTRQESPAVDEALP